MQQKEVHGHVNIVRCMHEMHTLNLELILVAGVPSLGRTVHVCTCMSEKPKQLYAVRMSALTIFPHRQKNQPAHFFKTEDRDAYK